MPGQTEVAVGAVRRLGWLLRACLVGVDAPRALSPCRPFFPVSLTGTLLEVKQGDTIVPNEQAILEGLPRHACVAPNGALPPGDTITVTDCDFVEFSVNATLLP